jgi:molybdenum cofactor synthesis domain-containing protein
MTTTRVAVVVASDRAHDGTYVDGSGPAAVEWLQKKRYDVLEKVVVPDEANALIEAVLGFVEQAADLVIVSGGTGIGPRDITPQTLAAICDYQIPGFGELLRAESLKYSRNAYLSRCGGWVKDKSLVLALPGNPKAVTEQLDILGDLLPHALKALHGKCKDRRPVQSEPSRQDS